MLPHQVLQQLCLPDVSKRPLLTSCALTTGCKPPPPSAWIFAEALCHGKEASVGAKHLVGGGGQERR